MGLVIRVSNTEVLNVSRINEKIAGICEHVVSIDSHLHFMPQAGELMTLLEILNEEGIAYQFQSSKQSAEC